MQGAEQYFFGSMLARELQQGLPEEMNKGANQALAMPGILKSEEKA